MSSTGVQVCEPMSKTMYLSILCVGSLMAKRFYPSFSVASRRHLSAWQALVESSVLRLVSCFGGCLLGTISGWSIVEKGR